MSSRQDPCLPAIQRPQAALSSRPGSRVGAVNSAVPMRDGLLRFKKLLRRIAQTGPPLSTVKFIAAAYRQLIRPSI